mmetsp:Transcript_79963/g.244496  ORF Transcript_79963/g.244496 Transcript_79963/m.244496 type:complete len:273 (-) Transcript_79963:293-1111(-)
MNADAHMSRNILNASSHNSTGRPHAPSLGKHFDLTRATQNCLRKCTQKALYRSAVMKAFRQPMVRRIVSGYSSAAVAAKHPTATMAKGAPDAQHLWRRHVDWDSSSSLDSSDPLLPSDAVLVEPPNSWNRLVAADSASLMSLLSLLPLRRDEILHKFPQLQPGLAPRIERPAPTSSSMRTTPQQNAVENTTGGSNAPMYHRCQRGRTWSTVTILAFRTASHSTIQKNASKKLRSSTVAAKPRRGFIWSFLYHSIQCTPFALKKKAHQALKSE